MRIVELGRDSGGGLDSYGSAGATLVRLAVGFEEVHLNVIHLEAGGELGRHPAGVPQVLLVTHGSGSVAGQDGQWVGITRGQAAVWEAGEEHATRADTDMSLLAVEAAELRIDDTTLRMPELD